MKRYTREWNRRKKVQTQNPVCGVFRPFDHHDSDDDDDSEEEEEEVQFLSFKEIKSSFSGGKTFLKRTKQRGIKGTLVDQRKRCRVDVNAGFHLIDPWWRIQILRTDRKFDGLSHQSDMCAMSYQLLEKEWVLKNGVLFQFLNKFTSQVNKKQEDIERRGQRHHRIHDYSTDPDVEDFDKFVCNTLGERHKLTFEDVYELLDKFENYLPEDEKVKARKLRNAVDSEEAQLVYKASEFPLMFSLLPQLLPMQFLDIICMDTQDLAAMEKDLNERPWVFGFKQILSKDHHIIGCEAQWNYYEKAGLAQHLQQPYRDGLLIYDYLKVQTKEGHTGLKSRKIQEEMQTYMLNYKEAISFLKRNKVVKEETIKGVVWIFLYSLYKAEEYIAQGVTRLFQEQMEEQWILDVDLESEKFAGIRSDPDQLNAAKLLTQLPVVVISGKGGCGKTTVVTKVMSSCQQRISSPHMEGEEDVEKEENCVPPESQELPQLPRILYTAPTGKAANLLGKRAGETGYTLHQVTYSFMRYCQERKEKPYLEWRFKNVNTLVVDECSLVAITTFHSLFKMLVKEANLRRIVLLGDVRQLPSIEPGNFLSDMFAGLQNLWCAVELRTNHRSESQLIIDNATRISEQRTPVFDPERNFKLYRVIADKDNDYINQVVLEVLRKEKSLRNDKTSQFVSFKKEDIKKVNEVCLKFYNNHPQKDNKKKLIFQVGDKICMTKNGQVSMYEEDGAVMKPKLLEPEKEENFSEDLEISGVGQGNETQDNGAFRLTQEENEKKEPVRIRLCNGEIFFIKDDKTIIDNSGKIERYLYLSNEDPDDARELWCEFRELRNKCKIIHAWARTIHTFQGSETSTVVYYLGSSVSWQNWQHVYTAVTRGKKEVYIVGSDMVLSKAISNRPNVRCTSLQYQLNKILPNREKLNQSLRALTEDTEDSVCNNSLPYTQTNSFCMDKPEEETFTRIKLSPYKPHPQSPRAGLSKPPPTRASTCYQPRPLNFSSHSISPMASRLNVQSPKPLCQQATSTPSIRQTLSNFSNVSPVQKQDSPNVNKSSNESQWSEVDESLLLFSEEQLRNEALFENCGPLPDVKSGVENDKREEADWKNDECKSDATQSPDENDEMEEENFSLDVKKNGFTRIKEQNRLQDFSKKTNESDNDEESQSLLQSKVAVMDDMEDDFDDAEDEELTRLCEVAERSFEDDQRENGNTCTRSNGDSDSDRSSPSLLSPPPYKSKKKMLKNSEEGSHNSFSLYRSGTEEQGRDLLEDSDDGTSSPSILSPSPSPTKRFSGESPRGQVTPKKIKMDQLQNLSSPMRRKLDNLSMSQD
ncbi:DNA helicase B-like [Saccostrea echinata]|uniref:DNA helicase B-like n=1 Tax=Saccostrea echinata TaxID=191078 RepID=UPI002A83DDA9|nr:DNA helicase B-like [Saccostrea echinata]